MVALAATIGLLATALFRIDTPRSKGWERRIVHNGGWALAQAGFASDDGLVTAFAWAMFGVLVTSLGLGATWIRQSFSDVKVELRGLRTDMHSRFDEVNARFGGADARFDAVNARLDGISARIDALATRLARIEP